MFSTQSANILRSVSTRVSPYRIILQSSSVNASCQTPVLSPISQQQTGLLTEEGRVNAACVVEVGSLPDPSLQPEGDGARAVESATFASGTVVVCVCATPVSAAFTPLSNVMTSSAGRRPNSLHGNSKCPECVGSNGYTTVPGDKRISTPPGPGTIRRLLPMSMLLFMRVGALSPRSVGTLSDSISGAV